MAVPNDSCISKCIKWKNWCAFSVEPSHIWFYSLVHWEYIFHQNGFVPMKLFYGGLIYPPYLPLIPNKIQELLIKYPTQIASFLGLPLPCWMGEIMSMILVKNPGWHSIYWKDQDNLLKNQLILYLQNIPTT